MKFCGNFPQVQGRHKPQILSMTHIKNCRSVQLTINHKFYDWEKEDRLLILSLSWALDFLILLTVDFCQVVNEIEFPRRQNFRSSVRLILTKSQIGDYAAFQEHVLKLFGFVFAVGLIHCCPDWRDLSSLVLIPSSFFNATTTIPTTLSGKPSPQVSTFTN